MCPKTAVVTQIAKTSSKESGSQRNSRQNLLSKLCSMCPKGFAQKGDVARHERTHTDEKPYACCMCPMRFAQKSKVARHEQTHTGDFGSAGPLCVDE